MINTNLATRPFYNDTAVRAWIGVVTLVVIALSVFNVMRLVSYSQSDTTLARQASQDEEKAANLRARADQLRASVNAAQIDAASVDARQANELIDRRTFSWTALWNEFEATLPPNVRITSFRPRADLKRGNVVTITVIARSVDDVQHFMESLEKTGAFRDMFTPSERSNEQGQLETTIEAIYDPKAAVKPAAAAPEATGGPAR